MLPLSEMKGVIARTEVRGVSQPVELIWAFGGVNGMKGQRGGDIGCEREPVSKFFQLRAEQCRGNEFSIAANTFVLRSKAATIAGVASPGVTFVVADANLWANPRNLLASVGVAQPLPVVVGQKMLSAGQPFYFALEQIGGGSPVESAGQLEKLFSSAEEHRRAIAERVMVETPDAFINAAAATLNIAADARFEAVNLKSYFNDRVTQIFRNDYHSPRSPFASLATPKQGIGGWCEPDESFDVNDSGLRKAAAKSGGQIIMPDGISLATPGEADAKNIIFTSQWDNYPREVPVPLTGRASHVFLLMAGSTAAMQSQFDNGEVIVTYADGSMETLPLRNPTNWWPIDQDYFTDDFAFRRDGPVPPRVDLRTGKIRILDAESFKGKGGKISGGAATVLDLPLDAMKELQSLTVRALANEVVIGLMSVTLAR